MFIFHAHDSFRVDLSLCRILSIVDLQLLIESRRARGCVILNPTQTKYQRQNPSLTLIEFRLVRNEVRGWSLIYVNS